MAEELRQELLHAAANLDAVAGTSDDHGTRYIIDVDMKRDDKIATVRSVWLVPAAPNSAPRLLTCYVLLG